MPVKILPDSPPPGLGATNSLFFSSRDKVIADAEAAERRRKLAVELSMKKAAERRTIKRNIARRDLGLAPGESIKKLEREQALEAARGRLNALNKIEEENMNEVDKLIQDAVIVDDEQPQALEPDTVSTYVPAQAKRILSKKEVLALQGTTRPEIARLMKALNIDTNIQLSKSDTSNLVACLLTCNEQQLDALYTNPKVPIAVKIIIKRMLDDAKVGCTTTVEMLWDRIFGKNGLNTPDVSASQQNTGFSLIPDEPISREAYAILHQTLISVKK